MHTRDERSVEGVEVTAADAPSEYHMAPRAVEHKGKMAAGSGEVTPGGEGSSEPQKRGRGRPRKTPAEKEKSSSAKKKKEGGGGGGNGGGGSGGGGGGGGGDGGGGGGSGGGGFPAYNGRNFMPQIISVDRGEDVSRKIFRFSSVGPRVVCVVSASGRVSSVRLRRQNGTSKQYDGIFDILSMNGYTAPRARTEDYSGQFAVTLAGPDGEIFGGVIYGEMIAELPVHVVVGDFLIGDQRGRGKAKKSGTKPSSSSMPPPPPAPTPPSAPAPSPAPAPPSPPPPPPAEGEAGPSSSTPAHEQWWERFADSWPLFPPRSLGI